MEKAKSRAQAIAKQPHNYILLRTGYENCRVASAAVRSVEGHANYVKVHLYNQSAILKRIPA